MQSHYENERQVKAVISRYQNDVVHARHLDLARQGQPNRIAVLRTSLRTSVSAMLSSARARLGPQAAPVSAAEPATELVEVRELAVIPAESPAPA